MKFRGPIPESCGLQRYSEPHTYTCIQVCLLNRKKGLQRRKGIIHICRTAFLVRCYLVRCFGTMLSRNSIYKVLHEQLWVFLIPMNQLSSACIPNLKMRTSLQKSNIEILDVEASVFSLNKASKVRIVISLYLKHNNCSAQPDNRTLPWKIKPWTQFSSILILVAVF